MHKLIALYGLPGGALISSDINLRTLDRSATQKVSASGKGTVDISVKTEPKYSTSKENLVMHPAKKGLYESANAEE